jgi:uncharacterized protein (DUF2249 family)
MADQETTAPELDVRLPRKPGKHPTISGRCATLPPGGSFVLLNGHDPKHRHLTVCQCRQAFLLHAGSRRVG